MAWIFLGSTHYRGASLVLSGKEFTCNAGDTDSIPGSGRSPGEGNGNSLQYSGLKNPMDRGAWQATVHMLTRVRHLLMTKPPSPHTVESQSVSSLSHVQFFATPWTAARQASLSITNSRSLLKLMSIVSVMPSNHLILCRPLFLLPSIFPSIRVFPNESVLHIRWPNYWSFSFSISPSSEHPGLICFRISDLIGSPYSPRDSQESSPTPQFKSIHSLALSFLYSPTLTFIHDHWKNHSLD